MQIQKLSGPFEYNSTRPHLKLAEYGRNVQNMVNHVMTLEDREERNRYAHAVIELMGQLNPHLRDVADFNHKLWDHLFIISNFQLDVDSPYPKPSPESVDKKPERLSYPANRIHLRHYGKNIEIMIERAKTIENPEHKALFVQQLANFMKMAYVTWNKDSVTDEIIKSDLSVLSNGDLTLDDDVNLNRVDARANRGHLRESKGRHSNQSNKKRHTNSNRRDNRH